MSRPDLVDFHCDISLSSAHRVCELCLVAAHVIHIHHVFLRVTCSNSLFFFPDTGHTNTDAVTCSVSENLLSSLFLLFFFFGYSSIIGHSNVYSLSKRPYKDIKNTTTSQVLGCHAPAVLGRAKNVVSFLVCVKYFGF